jgi:hypothetical protein
MSSIKLLHNFNIKFWSAVPLSHTITADTLDVEVNLLAVETSTVIRMNHTVASQVTKSL